MEIQVSVSDDWVDGGNNRSWLPREETQDRFEEEDHEFSFRCVTLEVFCILPLKESGTKT